MSRFNERTHSATKVNRINDLFNQLEQDRKAYVDQYELKTLVTGMDSQESESSQFEASEESQNAVYAARKNEMRNVGSNRSTGPNLRELNATPLSDVNAERSKTYSSFDKHPDQPSLRSDVVFDSFREGSRQHRRG